MFHTETMCAVLQHSVPTFVCHADAWSSVQISLSVVELRAVPGSIWRTPYFPPVGELTGQGAIYLPQ